MEKFRPPASATTNAPVVSWCIPRERRSPLGVIHSEISSNRLGLERTTELSARRLRAPFNRLVPAQSFSKETHDGLEVSVS